MSALIGVIASSANKIIVPIVNGSSPSPQTLTGGLYRSRNSQGTTSGSWTVNSDNLRFSWGTWSNDWFRTNNSFKLVKK
jgi:hypothetical protein